MRERAAPAEGDSGAARRDAREVLSVRDVSVHFGGVRALDDIRLAVAEHEVFGIIGPNGAGKTTLFNCISGFVKPLRNGRITFDGTELLGMPFHRIAMLGVARTFQNIALLRDQTVRMNLMIGQHLQLAYNPLLALVPARRVAEQESEAGRRLEEAADLLQMPRQLLDRRVDELPLGMQKKVELARALVRRSRLLLLDEPAGGLNDRETQELTKSIWTLRTQAEMTVVLVDHDMNLVMDVCDRIAVLDFGELIAVGDPGEIQQNERVISAYLGAASA